MNMQVTLQRNVATVVFQFCTSNSACLIFSCENLEVATFEEHPEDCEVLKLFANQQKPSSHTDGVHDWNSRPVSSTLAVWFKHKAMIPAAALWGRKKLKLQMITLMCWCECLCIHLCKHVEFLKQVIIPSRGAAWPAFDHFLHGLEESPHLNPACLFGLGFRV